MVVSFPNPSQIYFADFEEEVGIQIRKGRPRIRPKNSDSNDDSGFLFPMYDQVGDPKDAQQPLVTSTTPPPPTPSPEELRKIVEKHKALLTVQFRSSQKDGGNILLKVRSYSRNARRGRAELPKKAYNDSRFSYNNNRHLRYIAINIFFSIDLRKN